MAIYVEANLTVLDAISRRIVSQQFYGMLLNLIVSLFAVYGNATVIPTIILNKTLHNRTFGVLCCLAGTELIYSISQVYLTGYSLYLNRNHASALDTQLACIWRIFTTHASSLSSQFLTVTIALDRFCALAFPLAYRYNLSRFRFRYVNLFCVLIGVGFTATSFVLKNGDQILVACSPIAGPDKEFMNAYNYVQITLLIAVLLLSTATLIVLIKRLKTVTLLGERVHLRRELNIATCKTIGVIAVAYLLTWTFTSLCHNVLVRSVPSVQYMIYYPYCGTFAISYPASHLVVYLTMSRVFRNGYLKLFFRKELVESDTPIALSDQPRQPLLVVS